MMAARYQDRMENYTYEREYRVAFSRLVLRFERLAEQFHIDTRVGHKTADSAERFHPFDTENSIFADHPDRHAHAGGASSARSLLVDSSAEERLERLLNLEERLEQALGRSVNVEPQVPGGMKTSEAVPMHLVRGVSRQRATSLSSWGTSRLSRRRSASDGSHASRPPRPKRLSQQSSFSRLRELTGRLSHDMDAQHRLSHLSDVAKEVIAEADEDQDGKLDLSGELSTFVQKAFKLSEEEEMPSEELAKLAQALDRNGDGLIEPEELAEFVEKRLGPDAHPIHALIIVDVQNDFIDGTLSLLDCPACQDGAEVVPVINQLRAAADFDVVAISQDWHPHVHCSFYECFSNGALPAPLYPGEDPETINTAKLLDEVALTAPSDASGAEAKRMPQILWPRHCVQGTWGACCHPDLDVGEDDLRVYKGTNACVDSYSAFYDNSKLQETSLLHELNERGVTHVYICGLALDVCVAYTAFHAQEAGFATTVVDDACRGVDKERIGQQVAKMKAAGIQIVTSERVPDLLRRDQATSLDEAILAAMEYHVSRTGIGVADCGPGHGRLSKGSASSRSLLLTPRSTPRNSLKAGEDDSDRSLGQASGQGQIQSFRPRRMTASQQPRSTPPNAANLDMGVEAYEHQFNSSRGLLEGLVSMVARGMRLRAGGRRRRLADQARSPSRAPAHTATVMTNVIMEEPENQAPAPAIQRQVSGAI